MRYSLIIPHYNDTKRLERLLRTIPTHREDLEVLVIDDCSPVQSELEAMKLHWPMVRWLSTQKNAGAGAARNVGLEHAQGDHILFADSDDEFILNAFDLFDKHVQSDVDLVYFLAEGVQESDGSKSNRTDGFNKLCMSYLTEKTPLTLEQLKIGHVIPTAKVYSHKFLKMAKVKFEETRVANDVAFNVLAALKAENIAVVALPVYRLYRRPQSLTASSKPEDFLERVKVSARLAAALKKLGVTSGVSATGYMLSSLSYSPSTAIKTWIICFKSNMYIDWFRIFDLKRWTRFLKISYETKSEQKAAASTKNKSK